MTEEIFKFHTPKLIEDVKPINEAQALMIMVKNNIDVTPLGYNYCPEGEDFIKSRVDRACWTCGKRGHTAANCWEKPKEKPKEEPKVEPKTTPCMLTRDELIDEKVNAYRNSLINGELCDACGHWTRKREPKPDLIEKEFHHILPLGTSASLQPYNPRSQQSKKNKKSFTRKEKIPKMSSKEFNDRMTETFNPKQWRKEIYEHHKMIEGEYPTHEHIKDKKQVKHTTYHCGEWTQKIRNPKKGALEEYRLSRRKLKKALRKAGKCHGDYCGLQEEKEATNAQHAAWM